MLVPRLVQVCCDASKIASATHCSRTNSRRLRRERFFAPRSNWNVMPRNLAEVGRRDIRRVSQYLCVMPWFVDGLLIPSRARQAFVVKCRFELPPKSQDRKLSFAALRFWRLVALALSRVLAAFVEWSSQVEGEFGQLYPCVLYMLFCRGSCSQMSFRRFSAYSEVRRFPA